MTKLFRWAGFMKRLLRVFTGGDPPSRTDEEMKEDIRRRQDEVHARLHMLETEAAMKDQRYVIERRRVPRT